MKWTDEEIGKALVQVSVGGRLPSNGDLVRAGMSGLCFAVSQTGGYRNWALRLGLKTKSGNKSWNDELIKNTLLGESRKYGRMPSAGELRASGRNDLACAVSKHGGFRAWSVRLGLSQKGSETHRGQKWERHEVLFFRSIGFKVEEQPTKASFDLLVNKKKVDVKSSSLNTHGGYQFGSMKHGKDCDVYDLVCVENELVLARFLVPAEKAVVETITMTPRVLEGFGKYGSFRDAVHFLA